MEDLMKMDPGAIFLIGIIGFFMTAIIGLAIPIVLRKFVFKKPIKKIAAFGVTFLNLVVNFHIFRALGGGREPNPLPVFIVAIVAYHILHKGFKKLKDEEEMEEEVSEK